jgi:hypothetical protein
LVVPEGVTFTLSTYEDSGYEVTPRPPVRSDAPTRVDVPENLQVNDGPAFVANAIEIDFRKPMFERTSESSLDPPKEVLFRAITSLLIRIRYVTRGIHVRPVTLRNTNWYLRYLKDDGSDLDQAAGMVRGRGGRAMSFSLATVDVDIWNRVNSLGPTWTPPPWDEILLDANAALPHVGTVVALAATALEVFIANILDSLATSGRIPEDLWQWINDRGNWLKDPSTDEQFDRLLKHLSGHSLKEKGDLWEAFQNLRTARNTFVHGGVAMIGRNPLTDEDARRLLVKANEIVNCVRGWLPPDRRWLQFENTTKTAFKIGLT